jgi:hypothetical protein
MWLVFNEQTHNFGRVLSGRSNIPTADPQVLAGIEVLDLGGLVEHRVVSLERVLLEKRLPPRLVFLGEYGADGQVGRGNLPIANGGVGTRTIVDLATLPRKSIKIGLLSALPALVQMKVGPVANLVPFGKGLASVRRSKVKPELLTSLPHLGEGVQSSPGGGPGVERLKLAARGSMQLQMAPTFKTKAGGDLAAGLDDERTNGALEVGAGSGEVRGPRSRLSQKIMFKQEFTSLCTRRHTHERLAARTSMRSRKAPCSSTTARKVVPQQESEVLGLRIALGALPLGGALLHLKRRRGAKPIGTGSEAAGQECTSFHVARAGGLMRVEVRRGSGKRAVRQGDGSAQGASP